jgi:hypothetical protein
MVTPVLTTTNDLVSLDGIQNFVNLKKLNYSVKQHFYSKFIMMLTNLQYINVQGILLNNKYYRV